MKKNNWIIRIGAVVLALVLLLSLAAPALAADTTIYISSPEDLLELAENCKMDTWSQGKNVILKKDISLQDVEFTPIPTFGGTFDGRGHTISGLCILGADTPTGLFGVLQKSAVVRKLKVEGVVSPSGTAQNVGGIAGENYGVIQSCQFNGTVTGKENVGGIVGLNGSGSGISDCVVQGAVIGSNMTGGIAGQNQGMITGCSNQAQINTLSVDSSISLENMEFSHLLDITKWTSLDASTSASDTGGIAGYSQGNILSCINSGAVGYPHVGYNVGGIVGRTTGFVSLCQNEAVIHGRKDVGGIAGHIEPSLSLDLTDNNLLQLQAELTELGQMLTDLKTSVSDLPGTISVRLDGMLYSLDATLEGARDLGLAMGSYANDLTGEFNRVSLVVADIMPQLEQMAGQITVMCEILADGLADLETAMDSFAKTAEVTADTIGHLNSAVDELRLAKEEAEAASATILDGILTLKKALSPCDEAALCQALEQIKGGFLALQAAAARIPVAVAKTEQILEGTEAMSDQTAVALHDLADAMGTFSSMADQMAAISYTAQQILHTISSTPAIQIPQLGKDVQNSYEAMFGGINTMSDELILLKKQIDLEMVDLQAQIDGITAKFQSIVALATEMMGSMLMPEDGEIVDTSDVDINSVTLGKVHSCVNTGSVEGDLSVGGIAGTMSVEYALDPEDDMSVLLNAGQARLYETKAIIHQCVNIGPVTGKRSYVGGIVGQMSVGLVADGENYGSVISSGGNHIGGIAGICGAKIQNCFVKATLAGKKCVGGIVGDGITKSLGGTSGQISGCYAMVQIPYALQNYGAICGGTSGAFANNYFVAEDLGGINGVDYEGKASAITYEELMQVENLPDNFHKLTVSFLADGQVLKVLLVNHGQAIAYDDFPQIPRKDGYYAQWNQLRVESVRFDTQLTVQYIPYNTLLAGEKDRANGRPVFLVEGQFLQDEGLTTDRLTANPSVFDQISTSWEEKILDSFRQGMLYLDVVEQWQISIPEDGLGNHEVRYLSPEGNPDNLAIFVQKDGVWQEVTSKTMGSYVSFEVSENVSRIAVLSTLQTWWVWLIPAALVLALLALILTLIQQYRIRKGKVVFADIEANVENDIARLEAELETLRKKLQE